MKKISRFNSNFILLVLGSWFLVLGSCQKSIVDQENLNDISPLSNTTAEPRSQNSFIPHTGESQTVLGTSRANPWTTQAMSNAYDAVEGQPQGTTVLSPTHYYVKFNPSSLQDLKTLFEHDIMYYDYPLEYEVIEMGDYYDPGNEQDLALRPRYAVIPVGDTIPNVTNQVLEDLLLAPTYSYLTWKSYQLVGVDYKDEDALFEGLNLSPEDTITTSEIPWCNPRHPDWPQCLGVEPPPPPGDDDPPSGPCDCGHFTSRDPSGCISFEDTQLGVQGLPNIKVVTKDDWFTSHSTYTDEWGCWKINNRYRGKAWIWVRFKNEKGIVRSLDFQNSSVIHPIFSYMGSIKDYGGVRTGPSFNNNNIHYGYSDLDGSNAKRYWYGAHAIKSLEEFQDYCIQDGVTTPSQDLDILITGMEGGAAAPMLDDLFETFHGAAYISTLTGTIPVISGIVSWGNPVVVITTAIFSYHLMIWYPDVVYNYGNQSSSAGFNSDVISNIFYHEFAHASNYREVLTNESTRGVYWTDNISHIIGNLGYGDGSDPGSDRCAIIESWGYTIGDLYAHRRYGNNFSGTSGFTWLERLEIDNFWDPFNDFIPIGLPLDLNDGINSSDLSGVNDGVQNISFSQMFDNHSQACNDLGCFRQQTINNRGSNAIIDVETLLDDYDVN